MLTVSPWNVEWILRVHLYVLICYEILHIHYSGYFKICYRFWLFQHLSFFVLKAWTYQFNSMIPIYLHIVFEFTVIFITLSQKSLKPSDKLVLLYHIADESYWFYGKVKIWNTWFMVLHNSTCSLLLPCAMRWAAYKFDK